MIIDLREFQNITLDDKGIAEVGGGVRLGNLAQRIYDRGNRALSHGTCPGVGIGGHFTHGGYGYASRSWGLAMDQIIGLDVVLANGSAIHATDTKYPDVYYVSDLQFQS
jgi:FAD/FMN-containing dehydrogenase